MQPVAKISYVSFTVCTPKFRFTGGCVTILFSPFIAAKGFGVRPAWNVTRINNTITENTRSSVIIRKKKGGEIKYVIMCSVLGGRRPQATYFKTLLFTSVA
jgi:hypothetical protein